jgi:hypothetical protein
MQHMQDKDFDQMFRDKFEEAQLEPSLDLWNKIEQRLDVKPKRVFPIYWAAAAVVVIAITAGLLFRQPEKINMQGDLTVQANPLGDRKEEGSQIFIPTDDAGPAKAENKISAISDRTSRHVTAHKSVVTDGLDEAVIQPDLNNGKKDLLAMQPLGGIAHPDNKEMVMTDPQIRKAIILQPAPAEDIMLANAGNDSTEEGNEDRHTENKKIRNVGDLVNYVVDKVDKREEKFIQFKTDDDDNSSLVALNIGMFRFNSKKHK